MVPVSCGFTSRTYIDPTTTEGPVVLVPFPSVSFQFPDASADFMVTLQVAPLWPHTVVSRPLVRADGGPSATPDVLESLVTASCLEIPSAKCNQASCLEVVQQFIWKAGFSTKVASAVCTRKGVLSAFCVVDTVLLQAKHCLADS